MFQMASTCWGVGGLGLGLGFSLDIYQGFLAMSVVHDWKSQYTGNNIKPEDCDL